jgi:hypothetical protein
MNPDTETANIEQRQLEISNILRVPSLLPVIARDRGLSVAAARGVLLEESFQLVCRKRREAKVLQEVQAHGVVEHLLPPAGHPVFADMAGLEAAAEAQVDPAPDPAAPDRHDDEAMDEDDAQELVD